MRALDIAKALDRDFRSSGEGYLCKCPAHDDRTPSLKVSEGKNGNVLVHCFAGCEQQDVIDALKKRNLWPEVERKLEKPVRKVTKKIVATYDYVDPETGEVRFQVVRYEPKDFRQRRPDGFGGWSWSVPASDRILFNLVAVTKSERTVFIVEGEKDVEALRKIGITATCNAGGAGKWKPQYSQYLAGRAVVVLPDNDEAGADHAKIVATALHDIAKSVRIIDLPGLPPKGDVSDWIVAGGTADDLAKLCLGAPEFIPSGPVAAPVERQAWLGEPMDEYTPFKALGFDQGTYFYLSMGTQQIVHLTPGQHTKPNLWGIAPKNYWEREYPSRTGADYDGAMNAMMQMCHRKGIFSLEMLRGRGAWYDEGRVFLHLGDTVYVDKVPTKPVEVKSRHIYEQGLPMRAMLDRPLDVVEANRFVDLLKMMPWEKQIDHLLVAGWCVCAHVGGALEWRPHLWITGSKGSGKTHVMTRIIRCIMGDNCLFVLSETTEAGLRQTLKQDAIPVLFDEAEGEDARTHDRMQRILGLVRQASSRTGGRITKGTAGGAAMSFQTNSCFAFSSINAALVQSSDKSRVTVAELKASQKKYGPAELAEAENAVFTDDYALRFFARSIQQVKNIRRSARILSARLAKIMGEQRAADQLGTLLAGAWSLSSDEMITPEQCSMWLDEYDWVERREEIQGQSDEDDLFSHIIQQTVRIEEGNHSKERSIDELVKMVRSGSYDRCEEAKGALGRLGLKVEGNNLLIANQNAKLKELLKGTPWAAGWSKALRRLPGATSTPPVHFSGGFGTSRATRIPLPPCAV